MRNLIILKLCILEFVSMLDRHRGFSVIKYSKWTIQNSTIIKSSYMQNKMKF